MELIKMNNLYQYPLSNRSILKLHMNITIRELNEEELQSLKTYLLFLTRKTRKQIKKLGEHNEKINFNNNEN